MRVHRLDLSDQPETCSAQPRHHPSSGVKHHLPPLNKVHQINAGNAVVIHNLEFKIRPHLKLWIFNEYLLISFKASALFNFFSLWGRSVHILMIESENPTPHNELSSEMLMHVTLLEQFIKLRSPKLIIFS